MASTAATGKTGCAAKVAGMAGTAGPVGTAETAGMAGKANDGMTAPLHIASTDTAKIVNCNITSNICIMVSNINGIYLYKYKPNKHKITCNIPVVVISHSTIYTVI